MTTVQEKYFRVQIDGSKGDSHCTGKPGSPADCHQGHNSSDVPEVYELDAGILSNQVVFLQDAFQANPKSAPMIVFWQPSYEGQGYSVVASVKGKMQKVDENAIYFCAF